MPRAQVLAERAFSTIDHFLHIEAVSGLVLLAAAAIALIWANSPAAESYHHLWHMPVTIAMGDWQFSHSLHFVINDALMTIFFLVVGMEIRREMHEGALASLRLSALPLAAALGGVVTPALIYLLLNGEAPAHHGWAVPTATDIAFAVGVLALLGRSIPGNVRIFLLALAIIDDIAAVVIIALFYSGGLAWEGFAVAALGIAMAFGLQRIGVGSAYAYVVPGAVVWGGLLLAGAHPTLAGVVLGLITPVIPMPLRERPQDIVARMASKLSEAEPGRDPDHWKAPLRQLRIAQRELLPPVTRVQMALHPWVAYGVMPLFALANAGVTLGGEGPTAAAQPVLFGVLAALVLGKPVGVILASWIVVRLGWCRLPDGVTWGGVCLVGLLAGIGFTMSIFIAMLAFDDPALLEAAKLGVLSASLVSALIGLGWGVLYARRRQK